MNIGAMTVDQETLPCPTCATAVPIAPASRPAAFPFCSPRCRLRDLGSWADGKFTVAGEPLTFDPYAPDLDHP